MRKALSLWSASWILHAALAQAAPATEAGAAPAPGDVSFRGGAGLGGGSSGWAARVSAEFDYWFTPSWGAGGLMAYSGQWLLNDTKVILLGPAWAWRRQLDAHAFFGSATLGYASGTVTHGTDALCWSNECPHPRESVDGVAATANAGVAWALGDTEIGGALSVDWIPSSLDAGFAATVNIVLGSPL